MATDTETQGATEIPAGSWTVDPVHSVASFSVRHMMVGTFRGEFTDIDAHADRRQAHRQGQGRLAADQG